MNNRSKWQPLIYGVLIALGIFIGIWLKPGTPGRLIFGGNSKFSEVLGIINQAYVDTPDIEALEEKTLNGLLTNLDPHSVYIPAKDLAQANEQLEGNFEGVGIEFNILNDTIMVVSAINGGPSQELGIQAGDRIIEVDTQRVAGVGIKNEQVLKLLRGPKESTVKVSIFRPGTSRTISFTIKRNTIPIHSVDVSMMLNSETGYVKISRFAANTHDEFVDAVNKLKLQGLQNLILDLRDNPGGYLSAATEICDELLDDKKMIVYTQGRMQARSEYTATREGIFEKGKLVVLINEGSASASEIVSGAVQDWDRGVLVGRRSFGKGLVQEPFALRDGSAIRLTVARYYTPSGRCIQKPYDTGYDAYEEEVMHRFDDGEMVDSSKIKQKDSTEYKTQNGRIVFSQGGINPDVFVPIDTTNRSNYLAECMASGAMNQFAYSYVDQNRNKLKRYPTVKEFSEQFKDDFFADFVKYAEGKGVKGTVAEQKMVKVFVSKYLKALIARQIWRSNGYFYIINSDDPAISKSLEAFTRYNRILGK